MRNGLVLDIFAPFNKKFSTIRYPTAAIDENIFFKTLEDKISTYLLQGKKIIFVDFTVYLHDLYKQIS